MVKHNAYLWVLLSYLKYVNAHCLVMPTEIKYITYYSSCDVEQYPEELFCPYYYPQLNQALYQEVMQKGGVYPQKSCQTTKICCKKPPYEIQNYN